MITRDLPRVLVAMLSVLELPVDASAGSESDLSIAVSGPARAGPGTTVTYEVAYANAEPDPTDAGVSVAIPDGLRLYRVVNGEGPCAMSIAEKKEPLTYVAVVSNDGPDTAQAVLLTESWTFDDHERVQLSGFNTTQGSCVPAGAELSCSLGDLTTGASVTVTVTLTSTGNDRLTDTAVASAATQDPNLSNNTATVVTSLD